MTKSKLLHRNLIGIVTLIIGLQAVGGCGTPVGSEQQHSPAGFAMKAQTIVGLAGGARATAYDQSRDALWILSRSFHQAGTAILTLTRFNIADGTYKTVPIQESSDGFIRASTAVDADGEVWLAWGRSLTQFDPATGRTTSWALPETTHVKVSPEDPALDGNTVAIAVESIDSIWLAENSVEGLFHFIPDAGRWQEFPLPLAPTTLTRVQMIKPNLLLINGVLEGAIPALSTVDTRSGKAVLLSAHARDVAVLSGDAAIYVDEHGVVGTITISTGASSRIPVTVPASGRPELTTDAQGNVWFSMFANQSVGVGKLRVDSGEIQLYPFPQGSPVATGGPVLSCPGAPCNARPSVVNPQLQSIVVDANNNVWITTAVAGSSGDVGNATSASPLYEVPAGA
jgi:streptogramin lyase